MSQSQRSNLSACEQPLVEGHDLVMTDLDGVVYISGQAVPHAAPTLARLRREGRRIAFITNNASRPPAKVAANLVKLGIEADIADIVTSAQAAAHLLRERHGAGAQILVLGGAGLREALAEEELVVVEPEALHDTAVPPVSLVTGYGPDVLWRDIMRAAVLVRDGLPWVASNSDYTIPTSYGDAPGHGVLVALISGFADITPTIAGKPHRHLFDETTRRVGGARPLMIGDRLDTDIEGAETAGVASLLVMTGVTGLEELVSAPPAQRPDFLGCDLRSLLEPHPAVIVDGGGCAVEGWRATVDNGRVRIEGGGPASSWWRAVAVAAWTYADHHGSVADPSGLVPPAAE